MLHVVMGKIRAIEYHMQALELRDLPPDVAVMALDKDIDALVLGLR